MVQRYYRPWTAAASIQVRDADTPNFPMPTESPDTEAAAPLRTGPRWRDIVILSVVLGLFFALCLGSRPLSVPDEGRYVEIPREMTVTGDWLTPRLNGVKYFEKPPLFYWFEAGLIRLFGPSEWSARTGPALFALLVFGWLHEFGARSSAAARHEAAGRARRANPAGDEAGGAGCHAWEGRDGAGEGGLLAPGRLRQGGRAGQD